jgi:hypothetical protein
MEPFILQDKLCHRSPIKALQPITKSAKYFSKKKSNPFINRRQGL